MPNTDPNSDQLERGRRVRGLLFSGPALLLAFALAVMADPVSSVAYAIEAALRALHGDLALLLPTMGLVVALIALVISNYHQLVARFPEGGGAAAAAGAAFGEGWAFIPIGALIVDFVLTIAISVSAAASAVIAYVPSIAGLRDLLAILVLLAVGGLTWFGHLGRAVFAVMTLLFVGLGVAVLVGGIGAPVPVHHAPASTAPGHATFVAILLAFPVAMALATGVEAPSSAIAQLGQLDDAGRRRFGRITLWLTLGIVGTLTLGLTALAVHLQIGIPRHDSTQIADIAHASVGPHLFAAFQLFTALLLLAAASSSFQAGPGLLKALSRHTRADGQATGIVHPRLGAANQHHTPYWAVLLFLVVSAAVVLAAGARDQELVLLYAVSVFMSFFVGLVAMAKFERSERRFASRPPATSGAPRRLHPRRQPVPRRPHRLPSRRRAHRVRAAPLLGPRRPSARHRPSRRRGRGLTGATTMTAQASRCREDEVACPRERTCFGHGANRGVARVECVSAASGPMWR